MKHCGQEMLLGWDGNRRVMACRSCGKMVDAVIGMDKSAKDKSRTVVTVIDPGVGSEAEESFISRWVDLHPDLEAVREYKPCLHREWRLDFSWPDSKVAVELEGYGHQRDNRYKSDIDKYNWLAYEGWRLFRITPSMVKNRDDRFFRMVARSILSNEGEGNK